MNPPKHAPVAIIYDFDGTLAPGNMQDHQFIPDVGMKPKEFWTEVDRLSREHQADGILMYMYYMLRKAAESGVPVRLSDFRELGQKVTLFEGVLTWFDRISAYGASQGTPVEHYLISSGNAEIIEGTPIASKFTKMYASRFRFDQNGVADWPALAINFTTKTQYLFRINKGAHDLANIEEINRFVEKEDRPIPFDNMIYIGNSPTDVPCFSLVKNEGGLSIAVFAPRAKGARKKAERFREEGRVHSVVPANFEEGGELDQTVKHYIQLVRAREELGRTLAKDLP